MASQPPPAPPGQYRRDASICRCVAPLSNAATSSLPLPPPSSTAALSTNPNPKLPPSINYGSSLLSLRPSELSLPEVFSTHRTLAAPAPSLHVFKSTIIISATSLPLCPSVSSFRIFRHHASPQFAPTPPTLPAATPIALGCPWLPIDIRHDFPRHFPSLPLHRRRHKSAIDAAHDQQTPTSRRHRPPRNSVRRHATQRSRAVEIPYVVPALHAAPPPTHTSDYSRSLSRPPLDFGPPALPDTTCGASRMPSARRGRCSPPAPASSPPRVALAAHHLQRQRTPPSFAIATPPRRIRPLSAGIRGTCSPPKTDASDLPSDAKQSLGSGWGQNEIHLQIPTTDFDVP
ncbi:hypothetical protein DFH09DRAFT_1368954 [Mycena vulgaris]|nr:hypothetical protein DFH09DRAFT_1368954 [Mycena vulgaris]